MADLSTNTPFQPHISKLKFYSYGIVAASKKLGSKEVEVTPTEELPFLDGQVSITSESITGKGVDSTGAAYSSSVKSGLTLTATWLSLSVSNRLTAPDVRTGESVVLMQFGDADKYYWMTTREDMSLRRLETVIYGWSATDAEGATINQETMYWLEINTHRGVVHFHTSAAHGEPYTTDLQIDTANGIFTFMNNVGDYIRMDFKASRVEVKNAKGAWIDMNGKNITQTAPGDYTVVVGGNYKVSAKGSVNTSSGGSTNISSGSSATMSAGGSAKVTGSSASLLGDMSVKVASPATSIT
jgi:hypothetical protein